jgi:hypothetical protein
MEIRTLTHPTRKERAQIIAVLTDSFWRTPLFTGFLFRGHRRPARAFLTLLLHYSLKTGRVYVAEEPGHGIVACALWSLPGAPELNLTTLLRLRLWPWGALIAVQNPAAVPRICEMFTMLNEYAPETPCAALEFLASNRKGAGAALVRHGLADFADMLAYVESIVSKNDHAYYRQFGFTPFARTDFHGTDYAFMLRDTKEQPLG